MSSDHAPLAVSLMPLENRRDILLHTAITADALGYDAVMLPETWSHDVGVLLAEIATRTRRIKLGAAVMGVWGRSAATIAMAAATLHEVSGQRAVLGLGASTPQLAEGWHDVPYRAPLDKLRRTVEQVRAILRGDRVPLTRGDRVPLDGDRAARPLRLNMSAQPDLPIYLGATAPRAIRLAGELCDGWLPALVPRDRLADCVAAADPAAGASFQVCPFIPTAVSEDEDEARRGAEWVLAFYLTMMGDAYAAALSRYGLAREVRAVAEANAGRKPARVPAEAAALLDQLTIHGSPARAAAQLGPWYAAGATMPILMLNPKLSPEQIERTLEAFRPPAR